MGKNQPVGHGECTAESVVEEKFTKFSGEPRDASKNHGIQPIFGQILSKIDVQLQNRALPKFRNLVLESKIDPHSEIKINLRNRSLSFLLNLVSRPKNSNSPPSIWSESSSLNFSSTKILILY